MHAIWIDIFFNYAKGLHLSCFRKAFSRMIVHNTYLFVFWKGFNLTCFVCCVCCCTIILHFFSPCWLFLHWYWYFISDVFALFFCFCFFVRQSYLSLLLKHLFVYFVVPNTKIKCFQFLPLHSRNFLCFVCSSSASSWSVLIRFLLVQRCMIQLEVPLC